MSESRRSIFQMGFSLACSLALCLGGSRRVGSGRVGSRFAAVCHGQGGLLQAPPATQQLTLVYGAACSFCASHGGAGSGPSTYSSSR